MECYIINRIEKRTAASETAVFVCFSFSIPREVGETGGGRGFVLYGLKRMER